ncbi:MAG: cell division protein ZapA [Alphaproteobacteria bacterium HGW-Alphaproteobacteria-7]|jgi:cell division protein ZapA|nr:MAG: cell division protein ZapA [Alphaproteobacteria bacterium HGW-Alphaproteobacteria-7]
MSTVTLTIGPKSYTIACAEGEEAHISALGAIIAEKYAQLGAARAPLEAQNLLFAALFLADELAEVRKGNGPAQESAPPPAPAPDQQAIEALRAAIAQLEDDLAATRAAADAADADLSGGPDASDALAQQLEALATRAEATASALEAAAGNA